MHFLSLRKFFRPTAIVRHSILLVGLLGTVTAVLPRSAFAEFRHEGDISLRYDDRSNRPSREQYRFRWEPEYRLGEHWSVNAYVATGAAFPSAYNTFGERDDLHVRRLFGRWTQGDHKLEFGALPPYKGRVSSTGLSDEGWIRGIRGVFAIGDDRLEFVAGDLSDLRASNALSSPYDLNYYEVEYSGNLNASLSYEVGAERMFDENYARTELRWRMKSDYVWSAEVVHGFKSGATKNVLSFLAPFSLRHGDLEWFTYYSYVPVDFGARAVLTEDFLSFDHAFGTLLEYRDSRLERVKWFAELETGDARDRIKLGFELDFGG